MTLPEGFRAGFAAPQVFPGGSVDLDEIRSIATKVEAAGFDSLWTQDVTFGRTRTVEPVTLLSYLAGITERVRLGVSVLVLPARNPVQLAKALSGVDVLSDGRLTVGVGLGATWDAAAYGIPHERRVRRFLDILGAMKALWTEETPNFEGEFFQLRGTPMEPKPVQRPHPPIWFGATAEAAIRRAARHGDGWMGPGSSTPADFPGYVALLRQALEDAGRDHATFPISKRVYLAIDDDADRAERRLRNWFGHNYGDADMAPRVSIWGPPEHCYEWIDEFIDAGATHLMLNPVFDFEEHIDALRRYSGASQQDDSSPG
jgi:probable F420-dependent oxidoreductase